MKESLAKVHTCVRMQDGMAVEGYVVGQEPYVYILRREDLESAFIHGADNVKLIITAERVNTDLSENNIPENGKTL